jgi:A/G-specific adenine glycosylase
MLQQTRVEAVKGYFDRFVEALPDIRSLAEADEEKLLKLWEGLGYYSRVRNLQKAAKELVAHYNGELPADYEQLLTLPGVGSYTAGAIASIAYQIPVPAVDGNVLRVTKRIAGSFDDITKEVVKKQVREDLINIMPNDRPGDFNQSLMELGATICLPNGKPNCEQCPVMHLCKAFRDDIVMQIPVKPVKKPRRIEERTILLIEQQGKFLLQKRPAKGLLAGLWELPGLEGKLEKQEVSEALSASGEEISIVPLSEAKHIFSHVEWHMLGYHIKLKEIPERVFDRTSYILANKKDMMDKYSIPNAFAAYINLVKDNKI